MCTLSIIQTPDSSGKSGYRLVHSRDEQRSRGRAYPPAWRTLEDGSRVIYPTDSDAGGTWVVGSETGVTAGVLNFQMNGKSNPHASQSRGDIPLALIEQPNLSSMLELLKEMDLSVFACFTAFGVLPTPNGVRVMIAQWDGHALFVVRDGTEEFEPVVIASSGLGDEHVQIRVPLFGELVTNIPVGPEQASAQDAFTNHQWADCFEFSVLMSRKDARTVSITTVEVEEGGLEMSYQELAENDPAHDPVGAGMLQ
ncbi:MAG: NRDE family protein [Phycisphaerales bacterium]